MKVNIHPSKSIFLDVKVGELFQGSAGEFWIKTASGASIALKDGSQYYFDNDDEVSIYPDAFVTLGEPK